MAEDQKPSHSFLAGGIQQELIKLEDLPDDIYVEEESDTDKNGKPKAPNYTAARFFKKRPEDYQLCVAFLAAGTGLLKIARILKVHHQTVAAVRDIEAAQIDIQKERIKRNLRTAIDVGAERMPEIMAELPAGQVPIAMAVTIDKLRDMDGEPTHRIEHTIKGHLTHDAVLASLSAFPEAIEIEASPMVSRGENAAQKGADGAPGARPDDTPDLPAK